MKYVLMQDTNDETNQFYYVMSDDYGQLLYTIDLNCQPCSNSTEAYVFDRNTTPPCITPNETP